VQIRDAQLFSQYRTSAMICSAGGYPPEFDKELSQRFQWISANAIFSIANPNTHAFLYLEVSRPLPGEKAALSVIINGVNFEKIELSETPCRRKYFLDRAFLGSAQELRVVLSTDHPVIPSNIGIGDDVRSLVGRVYRLCVIPQ
jgi:hypothetical protein